MATTTAIGNDATDLTSILQSAMAGSYVAHGSSGQTFTVSKTIIVYVNSTTQGPLGLDLGGGTIVSNITDGSPVIQVVVGPGVDLRYLTFANLTIQGNGHEGAGIQVVAAGNDRWVYNFSVNNVTVNHVGGYGLDVEGSVFEGIVSNSWMTNNAKGGAYFSHLSGGQASALHWFGGGMTNNGGAGMMLDNGVRDMSVDGAKFSGNAGGGISAASGITSVSNSDFQDNHGQGVWFQNYGNFTDNTFESSGAQNMGITGWQNGGSTVVGNVGTWTGAGSDPTTLANLQGYGSVYATGDTGHIVTGSSLSVSGVGGGDGATVSVSTSGVSLPSLSAVTASTVASLAATNTGNPVETALKAAAAGTAQHLTDSSYTVSSPIVIHLTSAYQGPVNIDFGGAKIQSNISGGGPVIEIIVDAGVNVSQLTISNLMINGNGGEGDGIKIIADGSDRSIKTLSINSVNVEHVGGVGLDVIGNVHGQVFDSWMNGNAQGGARFANSPNGGVADGLSWIAGGFRHNSVAGLILENGTKDMTVKGAYFVENPGVGIDATSGITLVKESGFENNGGTAILTNGSANIVSDTFSTWGPQQVAVGGYLNGGTINMSGIDKEYYGSGSDTSVLANVQGSGKLALSASGPVIAGPSIQVTGSTLTASGTPGVSGSGTTPITSTGTSGGSGTATPVVTEALVSDTGSSSSDGITSSAALNGTADPGATIHFTVDGAAIATTATADASGKWSFAPTGLADGQHTIVASETNASGQTGSASRTFTLDTKAPVVTEALVGGGTSSATGALSGTTGPNAVVKFTVDGAAIAGTATADASGNWSHTPTGLAAGSHTIVASSTDIAGNTGSASLTFTMSTTSTGTSTTSTSSTTPVFTGGSYANGQITVTGTTPVPGETVWIYDGNNWVGAVTSDASGKFTFSEAAASGSTHSFGAIAIDSGGNQTKTATAFTYTATTSTAAPVVTEALTSDTGSSATDRITSSAAMTGTADPNSTVKFTVDGTAVTATATADASGKWSFTPTGLSDGQHTIVASETGPGGTGTASLAFTLDTMAPKVAASMTNGVVSGTGDANAVVHFTVDGNVVSATATADAAGAWSYTPTGLLDGQHTIVASETDVAGNVGSGSLSFTTGTTGATATLPLVTERLLNDTGASTTDKITSDPTLRGMADPNAVIHFTIDGSDIAATATANSKGVWSFAPTGLADGLHTVEASETNAPGQTGAAAITFTLDADGPIPTITKATLSGGTATIYGTTGEVGSTVSVYDGNNWLGTTTSGSDGTWSFTTAASSKVAHSYGANATDSSGQEGHGTNHAVFGASTGGTLAGDVGNDIITGAAGNDTIWSGTGAEKMRGGGGSDTFTYTAVSDSTFAASDTITDFHHGVDKIDFTAIAGINANNGVPTFQGYLTGTGNQTINAHSVAVMEVGGNTQVLVNTSNTAETVSQTDTHAADMKVSLVGISLGLTGSDFHHN
jgi:hypothetical protein